MDVPKIDVKPTTLGQLLNDMRTGKLQVPRFQRDFVWPVSRTRALLDSMYKEFPIGTFFLWRAPSESPHLFRSLAALGIPEPSPGAEVSYILDGQQRLTSLYGVMVGLKIGSRDYGRVCVDLETAREYDQNGEEGFDEDIFVYRTADNERYVAVKDLVHSTRHLEIFDALDANYRRAFTKAHRIFSTYPFSVVWIQEQRLGDAIEIFQRINQAGKRLSRYDLVCANVWTEGFDFRKRVQALNDRFERESFGALHETVYTQAFALCLKDGCTTLSELSLESDEIIASWDRVIGALDLAVDFARSSLGVRRADFLPYRGVLPVLTACFYHLPGTALTANQRDLLWDWFWRVTLSERYSSTSPSRMAEDAQTLRQGLAGETVEFGFSARVTPEAVRRTRMSTASSALRNAFLCLLALRNPRNLKDGSPISLGDTFFSNLKQAERHHIFPVAFLKRQGHAATAVHQLPNFCFIPADLNREISHRAPSDYMASLKAANPHIDRACRSQLIDPGPESAIWTDDYPAFLSQRAEVISRELNNLVGAPPDEWPESEAQVAPSYADDIDLLEVRLRDYLDDRLSAVTGRHYWKQTVPGDIQSRVAQLTREWRSRHPYVDHAQLSSGRARLDFCDVSDYEKIILRNWEHFEETFQSKNELSNHLASYRKLRNCVQHNRPASDIEEQVGKAAILWMNRALDKYDEDMALARDEDDESAVDEIPELEAD